MQQDEWGQRRERLEALKRASASDQRRDQRCGSAMGSKLVGGSLLVHHAERVSANPSSVPVTVPRISRQSNE
jgi:hypothetical protein